MTSSPPDRPKPKRDAMGRLYPGQVLNPGGRPKGIRAQIEARIGPDGADAWDVMAKILNGTLETVQERVMADGSIVEVRLRPTIGERKEVAETFIAYLNGRPATTNVNVNADVNPRALDDEALRLGVAEILARFANGTPAPALPAAQETITVTVEPVPVKEKG